MLFSIQNWALFLLSFLVCCACRFAPCNDPISQFENVRENFEMIIKRKKNTFMSSRKNQQALQTTYLGQAMMNQCLLGRQGGHLLPPLHLVNNNVQNILFNILFKKFERICASHTRDDFTPGACTSATMACCVLPTYRTKTGIWVRMELTLQ